MKRSNQVVLTAIFLTAVSSATARAQDVGRNDSLATRDSTDTLQQQQYQYREPVYVPQPVVHITYTEQRRGFFHFFRRRHHDHHNSHPRAQQHATATNRPRTRGFGTTMQRPAPSSARS